MNGADNSPGGSGGADSSGGATGAAGSAGAAPPPSLDNGLRAPRYVALTELDPIAGAHMLTVLRRARIPAYLASTAEPERRRLFVASEDRADARTVVASAMRSVPQASDDAAGSANATGSGSTGSGSTGSTESRRSGRPGADAGPDDDLDVDTVFQALVADWRVDTVAAVRDAERDLTREDEDWRARLSKNQPAEECLDEEHYVPPAPPPLPRLAAPTIIAVLVLTLSVLVLALGNYVGMSDEFAVVLGIGGLILAAGIFFTRIADRRDDDDDGTAV